MGIKSTIARNKFKKLLKDSNSLVDILVVEQLYKQLSDSVREENKDVSEKMVSDFAEKVSKSENDLLVLTQKLREVMQSDVDSSKRGLEKLILQLESSLATYKSDCVEYLDQYETDLVKKVTDKIDEIHSNLDKFKGEPGEKGEPGSKGENGSPDTPEEVVAKVIKSEKKIPISKIDGLKEQIRDAKRSGGGGGKGGGMGNPQHETKNVNSSTSTVQLDYPVAAGGRAAWLYYQGQFLVFGTHYTISGQTVSLLFTPENATFIDITYIRG